MIIYLGWSDALVPCMINPVNNVHTIYLLFDSVYLLTSARNNFINLKNTNKTFTFPDIKDNTVILHASFDHLKLVYNLEVNSTLKPLFSHSIERLNVRLALKIFDDSTAKALINLGPKHADLLKRHFYIYISCYKVVWYAEHQIIW